MKKGDVFLASIPGDFGKPRPVVIVQNDKANLTHASIVVCPLSSHVIDAPLFRLAVEPSSRNGLRVKSQIMVDKISAIGRNRLGNYIGYISDELLLQINRALAFWIGL
jgi:mRNA interferase MazF